MFRIVVCDDNPKETCIILSLLTEYEESRPGINFHIQSFYSGIKLLENIEEGQTFDLFLFDVIMPGMTGIELAGKLRGDNPDVPVVFLTSSPDYALPAYNVSAVQYLLKPVAEDKLFSVLDQILVLRRLEKDHFFAFSTSKRTLKISYSTIVYIEVTGHFMRVCLDNGGTFLSKRMTVPFGTAIAQLLEDSRFLYAHTSYLVNMDHVCELCEKTFVMTGGYIIPIPKYKIADTKDTYFRYLSRCGFGSSGGEK